MIFSRLEWFSIFNLILHASSGGADGGFHDRQKTGTKKHDTINQLVSQAKVNDLIIIFLVCNHIVIFVFW